MKIRAATEADRDGIWNIFHEVVAAEDTYALDPNISRDDALAYWFAPGTHTYVAELAARKSQRSRLQRTSSIEGTYILRPNQSGAGVTSRTQASWLRRVRAGRGSVAQWQSIA